MRELHPSGPREIWITRGHLWALAFMMVFVGVLAFFVGVLYGRGQGGPGGASARSPALIDASVQDDALDELLARLESLDEAQPSQDALTFPGTLSEGQVLDIPEEEPVADAVVEVPPGRVVPEPPAVAPEVGAVPDAGWSIQLASFPTPEEADRYVEELAAQQVRAYRQAALVSGQTRYRVRVGGYSKRETAQSELEALGASLGIHDAIVVRVE